MPTLIRDKSRMLKYRVLHVGILDQESEEGHRAADQEHPDDAVEPVLAINPVSDPMDGGLLWI